MRFVTTRKSEKSSVRSVVAGSLIQAVSAVAYGLAFVLVARRVGVHAFGELAAGLAIAFVGVALLDMGKTKALTLVQSGHDRSTVQVSRRLIKTRLLYSPLILLPLTMVGYLSSGSLVYHLLLFWPYVMAYGMWQILIVPTRADGNLAVVSACAVYERVVALAVTAALLGPLGAEALPLGLTAGALLVCFRLRRPAWNNSGAELTWAELGRQARPLAAIALLTSAQQLDIAVVTVVAGPQMAGVVAAAIRLIAPMSLPIIQVSSLIFARTSARSNALQRREILKLTGLLFCAYLPIVAVGCWQSDLAVRVLFGNAYAGAEDVLRLTLLGVLASTLTWPFVAWLQGGGHAKAAVIAYCTGIPLYLGGVAFAAGRGATIAVAAAFPALQLAVLAMAAMALRQRLRSQRGEHSPDSPLANLSAIPAARIAAASVSPKVNPGKLVDTNAAQRR